MKDECEYYFYDSGYCCNVKRENREDSSIDDDTVKKYCWGYHKSECPLYKDKQSSSSGCFLTSACVEAKGLPDNCYELTVLRSFRDGYMRSTPTGSADICEYYHIAPVIVDRIKTLPNPDGIFDRIYSELVVPCVQLIEQGQNEEAYIKYKKYTKELEKLYL